MVTQGDALEIEEWKVRISVGEKTISFLPFSQKLYSQGCAWGFVRWFCLNKARICSNNKRTIQYKVNENTSETLEGCFDLILYEQLSRFICSKRSFLSYPLPTVCLFRCCGSDPFVWKCKVRFCVLISHVKAPTAVEKNTMARSV